MTNALRTTTGIVVVGFLLFPLYWMVNIAFQGSDNLLTAEWFPTHPSLGGFREAIDAQGEHLLVSIIVAIGAVIICLLLAAPAAYGLSHRRLRGGSVVTVALLVTQMIPGIVIANALYTLYNSIHLLNSLLGLILADASSGIPFSILLMRAFMAGIPESVIEAAYLDGAGRLRSFCSIVIPLSRNSLITAGLFTFLFAWGDFLFALTLTTTEAASPITLGLYQYLGAHTQSWSALMATAALASVPAALLLLVAQRFLAAGITEGSAK